MPQPSSVNSTTLFGEQSHNSSFTTLQVEMYADYAPKQLMPFLVSSQWYPLEAALQVCIARGLVREQVFILGRMGSAHQALHLIIQRLADIPQVPSISPCKQLLTYGNTLSKAYTISRVVALSWGRLGRPFS